MSAFYKCYHNSRLQTLAVDQMVLLHRLIHTWSRTVSSYVAVSEFVKNTFVDSGLSPARITVRPNFLKDDPGVQSRNRSCAIFVGRLSKEKGIQQILQVWKQLDNIPLTIVGDGPLRHWVETFIKDAKMKHVTLKGRLSHADAIDCIHDARFLIMASQMWETFGLSIIEAFATATPVLASNMGAFPELVEEGHTGMLFDPYDIDDFRAKAQLLWAKTTNDNSLGKNSRETFLQKYSARSAIQSIMEIYEDAINRSRQKE